MALNKTSWNDLLLRLQSNGLAPEDFERNIAMGQIAHKHKGYYFGVTPTTYVAGSFEVNFSPSAHSSEPTWRAPIPWSDVIKAYEGWLKTIGNELSSPDLWTFVQEQVSPIYLEDFAGDFFSESEKMDAAAKVEEVRRYLVATGTIASEKIDQVNARLDYLITASERVTKKDWYLIFMGTLLNLVAERLIVSHIAQEAMRMGVSLIRGLLGN